MIVFRPARTPEEEALWEREIKARDITLEIIPSVQFYKGASFSEKKFVFDSVINRVLELTPSTIPARVTGRKDTK
jgi:hypothetical protein